MRLIEYFSFSQYNLQDYIDCKYRFLLKHIRQLEWPAVESEPLVLQEARMELGQQFHRLVQQYFIGMDPEFIAQSIVTPELEDWWTAFLSLKLREQKGEKQAEKLVSAPLAGHRLLSKYDLLIQNSPNSFTIFDWKTSSAQPTLQQLLARAQSRVYPLVLWFFLTKSESVTREPAEIEMTYWFPTFPSTPRSFEYSQVKFEEDMEYLIRLINEIVTMEEDGFTMTTNPNRCAYCRYRSLCDRGITAATLDAAMDTEADAFEFTLDFDAL